MKKNISMLVGFLFCLAIALFCLWYINYQVVTSDTKNILRLCIIASAFLGGFALTDYILGGK